MTAKITSLAFLFTIITAFSAILQASETEKISLQVDTWNAAPSANLSNSGDDLKVKSLDSSIWLGPQDRIKYREGDVVSATYKLRGGNLILQANWFDRNGNFLETVTLGRGNSSKKEIQVRVAPSDDYSKKSHTYELKFWIEADMPNLVLSALEVERGVDALPHLSVEDFGSSESVSVAPGPAGLLVFKKTGSESSASIVTNTSLLLKDLEAFRVRVGSVAPSSAFSVQAIYWSATGTYLGYEDLLKDVTTPDEVAIEVRSMELPEGTAKIGFKFWLSGESASAEAGILED